MPPLPAWLTATTPELLAPLVWTWPFTVTLTRPPLAPAPPSPAPPKIYALPPSPPREPLETPCTPAVTPFDAPAPGVTMRAPVLTVTVSCGPELPLGPPPAADECTHCVPDGAPELTEQVSATGGVCEAPETIVQLVEGLPPESSQR